MAVEFKITTTGTLSPVTFTDLGNREFTHPTVDYDLATEYLIDELYASDDIATAISSGYITVKDENDDAITELSVDVIHIHNNKAEIDLITDGDHDVRVDNPHSITKTQVGLSNVPNLDTSNAISHATGDGSDHADVATNTSHSTGDGSDHTDVQANTTHRGQTNNPHTVTKSQIGLGSVPNLDTTSAVTNDHTHSNKSELDLVTDGDHDVRVDNPHSVTKTQVGLSNLTNDLQIPSSQKGAANGVAELDASGKVPTSQLPSSIDEILEYDSVGDFPVTGETGKIYIATDTNKTYRWSGSQYVEISASLALGETSDTAYRGDRGKTAYDHSQGDGSDHADVASNTTHQGLTNNPHSVTKTQVGLGNVPNVDVESLLNTHENSITNHDDVDTSGVSDGDLLAYNETGGKWEPVTTDQGYTIFGIWAEEAAALADGAFEWAFGNGANTPSGDGIVVPFACEIFAMGWSLAGTISGAEIAVHNGTIDIATTGSINTNDGSTSITPVDVAAGTVINFRTVTAGGATGNPNQIVAWFRIRASALSTSVISDLLDVNSSGVTSNQILYWNGSNFVPGDTDDIEEGSTNKFVTSDQADALDNAENALSSSNPVVDQSQYNADLSTTTSHINSTSNPHSVTNTQVGLGNVTNDAQLKRADNDWSAFTPDTSPLTTHKILMERAADGAKRLVAIQDALGADSGRRQKYVDATNGSDSTGNGSSHKPWQTINYALSQITDNSSSVRYIITLAPGTYISGPITMKSYVSIGGLSTAQTLLVANTPASDFITFTDNCSLFKMTITGVTGARAIYNASASSTAFTQDIIIDNSQTGIYISGATNMVSINTQFTSTVTTGFEYNTTSFNGIVATGIVSQAATTAKSSSQTADAGLGGFFNSVITSGTQAFFCDGGIMTIFTARLLAVTNGIKTDNEGQVNGFSIGMCNQSMTKHIEQVNSADVIKMVASCMNQDKLFLANVANVQIEFSDQKPDAEAHTVYNRLHIGSPEVGYATRLGEGASYVRGMLVYTYNGSSYADVSTAARSASGSTFTFPSTSSNDAIYVASSLASSTDKLKIYGIEAVVSTACVPGSGSIVCEYWNGSAWTAINHMSTKATTPYSAHAKDIFERVEKDNIRLDYRIDDDWTKNDPMSLGTTYYWIRFRIATAITTAPVFEQFKVHSSHQEFNTDGYPESFGRGRPIGKLDWKINDCVNFGNSPGDQDLWLYDDSDATKDIGVGRVENAFLNGVVDRIGTVVTMPPDLDTSCPILLKFLWICQGNTGNVKWVANSGLTRVGDTIGISSATAESNSANVRGYDTQEKIVTVPGTTREIIDTEILLDVSEGIPRNANNRSDQIWLSLARDGGNASDTCGDPVGVLQLDAQYVKWSSGGHQ